MALALAGIEGAGHVLRVCLPPLQLLQLSHSVRHVSQRHTVRSNCRGCCVCREGLDGLDFRKRCITSVRKR